MEKTMTLREEIKALIDRLQKAEYPIIRNGDISPVERGRAYQIVRKELENILQRTS